VIYLVARGVSATKLNAGHAGSYTEHLLISMKTIDDLPNELRELVLAAVNARSRAYAPYSKFHVGAAVSSVKGAVFTGCNIENAAYSATLCAELVAISTAVAAGERSLVHLAIVGDLLDPLTPCGNCRQVINELAPELVLIMANMTGRIRLASIGELLPLPFRLRPERQAQNSYGTKCKNASKSVAASLPEKPR